MGPGPPGGADPDRRRPDRTGARRRRHPDPVAGVLGPAHRHVQALGLEADPGRGPDVYGPVRHDVRRRAVRARARHPAVGQGLRRRRPTDRRGARHRGRDGGLLAAPGRDVRVDAGRGGGCARQHRRDPGHGRARQRDAARGHRPGGARARGRTSRAGGRGPRRRRVRGDRVRAVSPSGASGSIACNRRSTCPRTCSGGRAGRSSMPSTRSPPTHRPSRHRCSTATAPDAPRGPAAGGAGSPARRGRRSPGTPPPRMPRPRTPGSGHRRRCSSER